MLKSCKDHSLQTLISLVIEHTGNSQYRIYYIHSLSIILFSAKKECSISEKYLENKPYFKDVLRRFLTWIDNMVKQAKKRHGKQFIPGM